LPQSALDQFDLRRFEPQLLRNAAETHPYAIASNWLTAIDEADHGDYGNINGPPVALYFYSPGPGSGKTHLAIGIAREAQRAGRKITVCDETRFMLYCWSASLAERERAIVRAAEQTWLTVIDDLGQKTPARNSDSIATTWYDVINRRWLARRWLIITSNFTLDELVARGSINDATFSRIYQMTAGVYVYFDADDHRCRLKPIT
jgi:DNA replication protein DnaC